MLRSRSLIPLAAAGSLFASLALAGCGGSSPTNIVTNPVTPPQPPSNIPVPMPTPPLVPADYTFTAMISAPSSDFSGLRDTTLVLGQNITGRTTTPDQEILFLPFSNEGQNITFQITLAKSGKIQAGDVIQLRPTSDNTSESSSEYTETFNSRSVWKADSGSARVDNITPDGLYTVSLLNVHYSPDTTTSAKGTFVIDSPRSLIFSVIFGTFIQGPTDAPIPSVRRRNK